MTDDQRPDPDALLAQIREDEQRASRGKLRIYFGSSAGVGKTYAMLVAARKLLGRGRGRGGRRRRDPRPQRDRRAARRACRVLPPAQIEYRGKRLAEFDLDGALARKPGLILVDELAHSNVAGSRHPKRWQDVEELLAAGIDVYSTLNVQHLESLNDVVGGITGIVVHETLPDTFFDRADEVVLVDTPADELIERLAAGKVYLPAQAERAAKNFFRKGNLMALRELALRRTADRVEDDVQAYRSDRVDRPGVEDRRRAAVLHRPAAKAPSTWCAAPRSWRRQLAVTWHAVYVETPALQRLDGGAARGHPADRQAGRRNWAPAPPCCRRRASPRRWSSYARQHNLSKLVLGAQRARGAGGRAARSARRSRGWRRTSTASRSAQSQRARPAPRGARRGGRGRVERRHPGPPLRPGRGGRAPTTLLSHLLVPYFDLANIVMVFLLSVVGVAVWLGRGPAVLAAFVNVAAFDFFFVAPRLSFAVSDVQYLLTFAIMLIVGLVTGQLTAGLRFQARVATHREARSRALFEAARDLSNMLTNEQAIEVAQAVIAREFRAKVAIYVLDMNDRLQAADDRCAAGWTSAPRNGRSTTTRPPAWAPTRWPAAPGCTCR